MNGLMIDYQLTLPAMLRRTEELFSHKEIVTRLPDKSIHRYTYADFVTRAKKLAVALKSLGVEDGDRVATLCWNHRQHLEAYFGIPASGAVLHTLNLRLRPDDLAYIAIHAKGKALLVDEALLPLYKGLRDKVGIEHVLVISEDDAAFYRMHAYEELLESADEDAFSYLILDEYRAAAMCYTSGTTGRPKGVLYSHRALVLHSFAVAMADTLAVQESDVSLAVAPMFHAKAWGLPCVSTMVGAKQVFPGPHLDPANLLELLQNERVTFTCGVPTIWLDILQVLDRDPEAYNLSALRAMGVGGSAAPEAMIRGYEERHGLKVI